MVEICTVDKNKASRAGPPSDPIPATWASYPTSLNLKFLIFKKKKKKTHRDNKDSTYPIR